MDQPPTEQSRDEFLDMLRQLNVEGFSYVVGMVWQQSKSAGGFTDKLGWLRLRHAAERYLKIR